ncbi:Itaconate transport protein [Paramyrothecium foliicola]|nr:Itaconate transport protein [Paramyrothecium foliicola]
MATATVTIEAHELREEQDIGTGGAASLQLDTRSDRQYNPVYSRFSVAQKRSVTWFVAYCGLLASMSTTSILAAVPEVIETFKTTTTVINISNALYLVVIGFACCFWGPVADTFGRKPAYIASNTLFLLASIGTALSPNLVAFFIFRALTAAQSTAFLVLGSTCVSDIYHPVERATAMGWFLRGTLFGPAFGPIISGIIVTYTSWRVIFWLQAAMTGVGLLLAIFVLHETLQQIRFSELRGKGLSTIARTLWEWSNPILVIKLLGERNLLCVSIASSTMAFNMYSLLTPIRYVLNPRLGLTTPLQSGLLYLAPGAGYLIGSVIGGRWSDYIVKTWSRRRGLRLWEDRLRGSLFLIGLALPGSTLLYGWVVDRGVGGIALPVICMFLQGVSQTCAFPCLNTYIMDVMQHKGGKASASHYFVRYAFAAVATASCIPLIDSVGVGWTVTISSAMVLMGAGLVLLTIYSGGSWRSRHRIGN